MAESRSSSCNVMPLASEVSVGSASCSPLDGNGRCRSSIGLMDSGSSSVEESIEKSKSHWSEVREFDLDGEVTEVSNASFFKTLQRHPIWGTFFKTFGKGEGSQGELVIGRKFAEGGQAKLYEVQIRWLNEKMYEEELRTGSQWVLKVFRKGTSLCHLQAQWPQAMLQHHANKRDRYSLGFPQGIRFCCDVFGGTLLEDGRFAFLMIKEQEDLRSWIDRKRSGPIKMGLLSMEEALMAMYEVAFGMNQLHDSGIVHRDLKASNVLVSKERDFLVADYECSVGVVGTGFFRAPEILKACKHRCVDSRPELFTKAADVYSYGMVCYEILTGNLPFEGHPLHDFDLVINGGRPKLPDDVDGWICKLLIRCWHSNPNLRPTSKEILDILEVNSVICQCRSLQIRRWELESKISEDFKGCRMTVKKWRLLMLKIHRRFGVFKLGIHFPSIF